MDSNIQQLEDVYEALVKIVGAENVTREECDLICYEKDFSLSSTAQEFMPDFAIHIRTTEQASEVVKLANRYKIPIVPRGGGTNQWGVYSRKRRNSALHPYWSAGANPD